MNEIITCSGNRRFGVEIEINAFDGVSKPVDKDLLPTGIHQVADLIQKITNERVVIDRWHLTHDNKGWVVKPDSSCGIEICSPVYKGWKDLRQVMLVADAMKKANMVADSRCSMHVHVNLNDISDAQLGAILAYWVKCEAVFIDAMPHFRRKNRYCQFIGISNIFKHDETIYPTKIVEQFGKYKYYSVNSWHLSNKKRRTIEFRLMENDSCLDGFDIKNWTRLVLHFVEMTKGLSIPCPYVKGHPFTGLCWLDPKDVFSVLKFDSDNISDGLKQVRSWFLRRLYYFHEHYNGRGFYNKVYRGVAYKEIMDLYNSYYDSSLLEKNEIYSLRTNA